MTTNKTSATYHTRSETSEEPNRSCLLSKHDELRGRRAFSSFALVDLAEKGVGGLREDGGGETLSSTVVLESAW